MFGCFFGHDWKYLGRWLPVNYERGGYIDDVEPAIPATCLRCGEVRLKAPQGSYSVSIRGWEAKSYDDAMEEAQRRAAEWLKEFIDGTDEDSEDEDPED